jgi:hypothetical protein
MTSLLEWAVGAKGLPDLMKPKGRMLPYNSIFLPYGPTLLTVASARLHRPAYWIYLPLFSIRSFWCFPPVQNTISHDDGTETRDEGIQISLPSIDLIFSSSCRAVIVDVPYRHLPQTQSCHESFASCAATSRLSYIEDACPHVSTPYQILQCKRTGPIYFLS